jgi:hypothetical protein
MDTIVDWEKASSTQTKIEDVENIRDLSLNSIEAIDEVNAEVLEERFIQPAKLILLTGYSLDHVEHRLKTRIITPICNKEMDLKRTQFGIVETILEDIKMWKGFINNMQSLHPFLSLQPNFAVLIIFHNHCNFTIGKEN